MDRRTFIRNSSFSVLALGLSSLPVLGSDFGQSSSLQIEQGHHIRHGLLQQLDMGAFKDQPVLFQRNHFTQGIAATGASEQLEVVSILSRPFNKVQSLQLSVTANQIDLVVPGNTFQVERTYQEWQMLYQDDFQRVELYSGRSKENVVKSNPKGYSQYFLTLSGTAKMDLDTISPHQGLNNSKKENAVQMLQNNSSILCVSQINK